MVALAIFGTVKGLSWPLLDQFQMADFDGDDAADACAEDDTVAIGLRVKSNPECACNAA